MPPPAGWTPPCVGALWELAPPYLQPPLKTFLLGPQPELLLKTPGSLCYSKFHHMLGSLSTPGHAVLPAIITQLTPILLASTEILLPCEASLDHFHPNGVESSLQGSTHPTVAVFFVITCLLVYLFSQEPGNAFRFC